MIVPGLWTVDDAGHLTPADDRARIWLSENRGRIGNEPLEFMFFDKSADNLS